MTDFNDPIHRGWVPVEPVRRVIKEWEEKVDYDQLDGNNKMAGNPSVRLSPLGQIAAHVGVPEDTIYGIRTRKTKKYVSFDLVDRIVCFIDGSLWRSDEELREIYYGLDMAYLDSMEPTSDDNMVSRLVREGLTTAEISRRTGIRQQTIKKLREKQAA